MSQLTIHSVLMAVRGLSNEVTVRALASDLHVSTSTIMRCKSGLWPPSITFDAMRDVLDGCRTRFFGGDGAACASSVLAQLRLQGVETDALAHVFERDGYETFVSELLVRAAHPDLAADGVTPLPPDSEDARQLPEGARRVDDLLAAMPVVVILLVGLLGLPLSTVFAWIVAHRVAFVSLSLFVAVLPALLGITVDVPLAWRAYRRRHPDAPLSFDALARVAKYGDVVGVVPGAGRYNLSASYVGYQVACNVSGMLCYVSLLAFLLSLPGFESFFESHEWAEFFKVGIAVGFVVAYGHTREVARRPGLRTGEQARDVLVENPDTYRLTRAHVWANGLHLLWTVSLLFVLSLSMIAYGIVYFRHYDAPTLVLWPYLQAMAFFAWSCISPQAIRIRATCIGSFLPSVSIVSLAIAAMTLVCYRLTGGGIVVCVCCALCLAGALLWTCVHAHGADCDWLVQGRGSGAYMLVAAASMAALLIVGVATSAFL